MQKRIKDKNLGFFLTTKYQKIKERDERVLFRLYKIKGLSQLTAMCGTI